MLTPVKKQIRPLILMSPGPIAGAEKVVLTGLKALRKIGINPLMVIIKESRNPKCAEDFISLLDSSNVEFEVIESHKALDFSLILKFNNLLKKYPDITHTHSHGFKALFTNVLSFSKLIKVHTHHGNTGHTFKVKVYEALAYFLMRFCQGVICVSQKMQQELQQKIFGYSHFFVCNNMLSFEKEELPIQQIPSHSPIRLIYIGRLSPEKGILDFITVFNQIKNKEQFHFTILGDGIQKETMVQKLQNLNIKNVNYVGNVKDPSSYLKDSDLLVMPSHTEGLPMTLIESLASSVPVISNEVGAINELVTTNFNGKLISYNGQFDYQAWINVLEEIPSEVEKLKINAFNGKDKIINLFGQENWAKTTLAIYQQLS